VSRVDRLLAHCRPAKASRGEIGELTATRHLGPGGFAGSIRSAKAKMMMLNMSVALVACHRTAGGVLKRGRTISPVMRSLNGGSHGASKGMRIEGG
jgi:hypothetical protein